MQATLFSSFVGPFLFIVILFPSCNPFFKVIKIFCCQLKLKKTGAFGCTSVCWILDSNEADNPTVYHVLWAVPNHCSLQFYPSGPPQINIHVNLSTNAFHQFLCFGLPNIPLI
eukprot:TRINITY_DN12917_c0_g1_i3.p1 TRINITY_DN12917_c0_g1~~TRINITY_DN12917_c0_g1_i3.p1  ORF type:complete len:113 (-),score=7.62 TRINITY_DN12917_c0_g1_i3:149-487(-)